MKEAKEWVAWQWLEYMQKCNPTVPGLAVKLFPPHTRDLLTDQTKFWKLLLAQQDFHCIYSNTRIEAKEFSLDHFLPWSFVVHDELWNLIPTTRAVNSSKGDRLPAEKYIDALAISMHNALKFARQKNLAASEWEKLSGPFFRDLGIESEARIENAQRL